MRLNHLLARLTKFFDLYVGWFFVNGEKQNDWTQSLNEKYNKVETDNMMNAEMEKLIRNFPNDIKQALNKPTPIKISEKPFKNIVLLGMGGSGIGCTLVKRWFEKQLSIPVITCQDYSVPVFVDENTFVIACSYSGNTEETLSALEDARTKKATIHGITSGGKLEKFCDDNHYSCSLVPGGFPPRTQLAHMSVLLTSVLVANELIPKTALKELNDAYTLLLEQQDNCIDDAKKIARVLENKNIIIYTSTSNEALAIRARQQFHENAKMLCSHHVIPEMNHNELVGWAGGTQDYGVLFILTNDMHSQNVKRFKFTQDIVSKKTDSFFVLESDEESSITASFYLIHTIDWASYFLANQKGVNATEVNIIENLKNALK